ncbi:hypothetical protein GCM10007880_65280 [Mesorhizobium amorphae]|nr:hypothetical protein GCM10007880_65280 [Mesorhizobium amorphae]
MQRLATYMECFRVRTIAAQILSDIVPCARRPYVVHDYFRSSLEGGRTKVLHAARKGLKGLLKFLECPLDVPLL